MFAWRLQGAQDFKTKFAHIMQTGRCVQSSKHLQGFVTWYVRPVDRGVSNIRRLAEVVAKGQCQILVTTPSEGLTVRNDLSQA